ncbi:hypothetical protein Tco_0152459 [Tanacetum coccineum]
MKFEFAHSNTTMKQGNYEDTSSKAMLAIDGVGFDWSDMAEEQVQTNMALMAFSDSEVYNDKTCSKTCLKNYETLKKQCDDLIVKLNQTEFTAATYKRGLATVEEQLITYRKNEVLFSEEVAVLKREVACKDYEINVLKSEFEKVKQEKEGIEFKIEKFDKASKDLDKLLGSQISDKSKKGLGYSVVPPPHPLIYNRPKKINLSYSGLDEFKEPEFKGYGSEDSKKESNVVCDKKLDDSKENSDNSSVKEQASKDTSSFVDSLHNVDKETTFPVDKKVESVKPKNHEKPVKKSVRPVNTAHPKPAVHSAKSMSHFSKQAQSSAQRPFYKQSAKRHYYSERPRAGNIARHVKRGRDTKIPQSSGPPVKVGDEVVHKELGDRMERAPLTSIEALGSRADIIRPKKNNPWQHLMDQVLRKLVQVVFPGNHEDASKQERSIEDIDKDVDVSLVDDTQGRSDDAEIFNTNELHGDEVVVDMPVGEKQEQSAKEREVNTSVEDSAAPTTIEEITLAQTLIQIKAANPKVVTTAATTTTTTRPKARGVVVQEPSEFRTPQESQPSMIKDKGKAIMIEPEVPLKRKDQVALDEDLARNLQAQLEAELIEEERLARKKEEEANIALIESWDNTQAMMEADFELAQRLQTEEQGEITIEERSRLFVELMNKRKKHFAMLRAEEKRRKPPTKAQKRNLMSTYLKNMGGYKHNQLKSKSYEEIQKMFDNEMRRVNTFIPMDSKSLKAKVSEEKAKGSRKKILSKKKSRGKETTRNHSKETKEWRMIKETVWQNKLKKLMKLS